MAVPKYSMEVLPEDESNFSKQESNEDCMDEESEEEGEEEGEEEDEKESETTEKEGEGERGEESDSDDDVVKLEDDLDSPCPNLEIESQLREMMSFLNIEFRKRMGRMGLEDDPRRVKDWRHRLSDLRQEMEKPIETVVGVVGETGHGKSSLINSLLGFSILAESSLEACTSVPIELRFHSDVESCKAVIQYLEPQEWENELRSLVAVNESESNNEENDEDKELRESAGAKFSAVYPTMKFPSSEESLNPYLSASICSQNLGTKADIRCRHPDELQQKLRAFLFNTDGLEKTDSQLWPLIKSVQIEIPVEVLQNGVVLVDLPGLGDVNKARTQVTNAYLEHASTIMIVSKQERVVESERIDQLITRYLKSKLRDGDLETVTFATTMAETICEDGPFTGSKKFLDDYEHLKQKRTKIQDSYRNIQEKLKRFHPTNLALNIPSASSSGSPFMKKRPAPGNFLLPQAKSQKNMGGKKNTLLKQEEPEGLSLPAGGPATQHEQEQISESQLQKELSEYKWELTEQIPREETRLRALARNEKSRIKLQELFTRKLKQTTKELGLTPSDPQSNQAVEVEVFCTSAKEFLKMSKQANDLNIRRPTIFQEEDETEVPLLVKHLQKLGYQNQRQRLSQITNRFMTLLSEVELYLDSRDEPLKEAEALKEAYLRYSGSFYHGVASSVRDNKQTVKKKFSSLERSVIAGHTAAKETATETIHAHDRSPPRANTFKAIMAHEGSFRRRHRSVDYNTALADSVVQRIQTEYNAIFQKPEDLVKRVQDNLPKILEDFLTSFEHANRAAVGETATRRWLRVEQEVRNQVHEALQKNKTTIKKLVGESNAQVEGQPKTVWRVVGTCIEENLQSTYNNAALEKGSGMYTRMKSLFFGRLESNNDENPFSLSEKRILFRLEDIQEGVKRALKILSDDVHGGVARIFTMLWPDNGSESKKDYGGYLQRQQALGSVKNQIRHLNELKEAIQRGL